MTATTNTIRTRSLERAMTVGAFACVLAWAPACANDPTESTAETNRGAEDDDTQDDDADTQDDDDSRDDDDTQGADDTQDADDTQGADASDGDDDSTSPAADDQAAMDSAYVIGTRIWDDVGTTSYFHVVSSLDQDEHVDESKALEIAGAAKLYAVPDVGWFAVGGGEEPTITRYTLDDERLVAAERISLALYGVESLWDTLYVVSSTKMYYPDRDNSQLIIINPEEMRIDGAIDLSDTVRDGYLSLYAYTPHFRDGQLLFSVGWFDWTNDNVLDETGLVVIDTDEDKVVRVDVDARCGGITTSLQTSSGDAYFVSSALAGVANLLGRLETEPCALRVLADESAFDADYLERLEDVTGSAVSGEPIPAGGDAAFLRVLDEDLVEVEEGAATWEITGQVAWRWVRWDIVSGEVTSIDELEPSTSDVLWFDVDGAIFGTETTADYSETTLIELTASDGPKRALTAPGFLHGVAKVR